MREYALKRGWTIAVQIKEVASGAVERELREKLIAKAQIARQLNIGRTSVRRILATYFPKK